MLGFAVWGKRPGSLNSANSHMIAVYKIISSMQSVQGDWLLLFAPVRVTGGHWREARMGGDQNKQDEQD